MKRTGILLIVLMAVFCLAARSNATLTVEGTDSLGYQLIYDSALNVTWYDCTQAANTWQNQMNWAANLTVTVNGQQINGWSLPTTIDGPYVFGYDGSTTGGYNITNPADMLSYLYYVELGNNGEYNTSGGLQSSWGLTNTGPFKNLNATGYWTGTAYSAHPGGAWVFCLSSGYETWNLGTATYEAIAEHPGNVNPEPIPGTLVLLGSGLACVCGLRSLRRDSAAYGSSIFK